MAVWDLRKLQLNCESKTVQTLYLIASEDLFLIQEALSALKTAALQDVNLDFNSDSFFAPDTQASHVRDTAEMLPMMSPRRVVIYRNVDVLKEKDWEVLFPLFDSPVESTTFILVAEKIDKRKKYYKKIYDNGVIVELKRPFENQMPMWIDYIARKSGLTIHKEAIELIEQFVGINLAEINNEIVKLQAYLGDRTEIRAEDVMQVVSQSRVESVFELANAIGKNDRAQALTSLAHLLEQGQNEVGALALITRHIRIIANLNDGLDQGLSGIKLATKAGIPQFFLTEYLSQAKRWKQPKIKQTLHSLLETDRALKSSPISPHIWLENFILQTCRDL